MRRDLLTGAPITPPEPGSTTVYIIKRDDAPRTNETRMRQKRHATAIRDADKERQALHDFAILLQYIDSHQDELAAYAQVTQ